MRRAIAIVALVLAAALAGTDGHAEPADARTAACATCHQAIADEWRRSAHRRSGTDPAYVEAVTKEPLPFCRACHVPSGDASRPTPAAVAERGIGCVDCHASTAPDHAQRGASKTASPARTCASCHEFRFPSGKGLMQKTATEHARSALSASSCESCHMPAVPGPPRSHVDHRFEVDDAMLARALVADVARAGPSRIAVRLVPGKVGHAMPTGDLFRRLEVRATATDAATGDVLGTATRYLSRKFRTERVGDTAARVDAFDDRVGADLPPCFELDLGRRAAGAPIALAVTYQRVQEPRTGDERGAVVTSSVPVFGARIAEASPLAPCGVASGSRTGKAP